MRKLSCWMAVACVVYATAIRAEMSVVPVLEEDFEGYPAGLFSSSAGAHTEYHYSADFQKKGNWAVSTFRSSVPSQRAWRIVEDGERRAMAQVYSNKDSFYHPMIVAGDPAWRDYGVTVTFKPQTDRGQRGFVFRYRNDRCYYFLGVDGQRAVLKRVNHASAFHVPDETILDEQPLEWVPGSDIKAWVGVHGNDLSATIGDVSLHATDDVFTQGGIGLTADAPTFFYDVRVGMDQSEMDDVARAIEAREDEEAALQAANPKPALWKKIDLKEFGVGRSVRFGDLNGDEQPEALFAQVLNHGPKDRNSEVSCLTAMTFDGKQLWQVGEADPWKSTLTSDVAVQIHDLDGDGKNEVVYCKDMRLIVADGATGETRHAVDTPEIPANTPAPYNKFPRVLGDAIYFCDLRGTGRDADIILKDRYLNVWALNDQLEILWHAQCNTGHYPHAHDMDGDGKDEIMIGYTLFDDDGTKLWTLDDEIEDHADGVAIVPFRAGEPPRLLCAASDEGMFFADMRGQVLKHHYIGHVQNPAIADYRPDLPGLEAISINFWGNQGIVHFYDAGGDIYHDFEPAQHGSMCLPVNWTGKPGEFWVLSANVEEGGMFDGRGRRVVKFRADGHPDMCNAVLDITGDAREEIVVWDTAEMWVYTQDDSPRESLEFESEKNPLYNYSNYQTTVSLPTKMCLDTSAFNDGIGHWRNKYGRDRNDARYSPYQIAEIADNILRYQNADGGWPKNLDYLADIDEAEVRALRGHTLEKSTFDNRTTYSQIDYLARAYGLLGDERYRAAAEHGLDFLTGAQHETGGWRGADVDAITFNDGVMTGIMALLFDIRNDVPRFTWLDAARRTAASESLDQAIDCVLKCQIEVAGTKTGWCQQHDHETFAAVKARSYELPAICAPETADVLQFLMKLPAPDARIRDAIERGVAWLDASRIDGIRVERVPMEPVRFENHTAATDRVVVEDPDAPPLWARYYEIETNRPFFCNRDGVKVYTLAEVALERRTGYAWYSGGPASLIENVYPAWRARLQ